MDIEPFMLRAVLTALFLGPLCGFIGVFVTARRMSFFSDTVAHAALAGVALGFWLGLPDPTVAASPATLAAQEWITGSVVKIRISAACDFSPQSRPSSNANK